MGDTRVFKKAVCALIVYGYLPVWKSRAVVVRFAAMSSKRLVYVRHLAFYTIKPYE